jgi:mono/diheme cytochrome c family protein
MSSTKEMRGRGGRAAGRGGRVAFRCLLLAAGCLLLSGCRQDMQDTPRYEAYEAGGEKFSERGQSSRTLVEGTVARGFLRDDALLYTGRAGGAQPGASGGTQAGGAGGAQGAGVAGGAGMGTASGAQSAGSGAGTVPGQTNVRGNVAGGAPGAAAGMGGPDVFPMAIDEQVLRRGQDRFNAFCAMCHGAAGDGDGMIPRRGFQRPPSFHDDRLQEGQSDAGHFFDVITNGWGAMPAYAYMIPPQDRWNIIAYVRALQLSRRLNQGELTEDQRQKVAAGYTEPTPSSRAGEHQRPDYGGRERPEVREERHR